MNSYTNNNVIDTKNPFTILFSSFNKILNMLVSILIPAITWIFSQQLIYTILSFIIYIVLALLYAYYLLYKEYMKINSINKSLNQQLISDEKSIKDLTKNRDSILNSYERLHNENIDLKIALQTQKHYYLMSYSNALILLKSMNNPKYSQLYSDTMKNVEKEMTIEVKNYGNI